jgi:hypothetical protein
MEAATAAKELAASQNPPALNSIPEPTPIPIPPQPAQPSTPAPSSLQAATSAPSTNVPLSQIEQNPTAYTQPRANIQVPVRGPEETNQP